MRTNRSNCNINDKLPEEQRYCRSHNCASGRTSPTRRRHKVHNTRSVADWSTGQWGPVSILNCCINVISMLYQPAHSK